MKNIDSFFFHERRLIIGFLGKKVHKLYSLLIGSSHGFNVLKVVWILYLSSIHVNISRRGHSHTIHHVRIGRSEPVCHCVVIGRVFVVSIVAYDIVAITGPGCGIVSCCDLDSLVLYFLEIHLFHPIAVIFCCVTFSNSISSITDVYIACVLQVQCWNAWGLRCFWHCWTSYLFWCLKTRRLILCETRW